MRRTSIEKLHCQKTINKILILFELINAKQFFFEKKTLKLILHLFVVKLYVIPFLWVFLYSIFDREMHRLLKPKEENRVFDSTVNRITAYNAGKFIVIAAVNVH